MTAEDFSQESDYQAFIERLRTVRERYPFFLYAYVLMSNHFHLTPLPAGASVAVLKLRLLTALSGRRRAAGSDEWFRRAWQGCLVIGVRLA